MSDTKLPPSCGPAETLDNETLLTVLLECSGRLVRYNTQVQFERVKECRAELSRRLAALNPAPPTSGVDWRGHYIEVTAMRYMDNGLHRAAAMKAARREAASMEAMTGAMQITTPADESGADAAAIGTKAPAIGGGWWFRTANGWKWNGPDGDGGTFPRPGGDWTGELIAPRAAAQEALTDNGRKALDRCIAELTGYAENPDDHGFDEMGVQALQTAIESMQLRKAAQPSGAWEDAARWRRHDPEIEREAEAIYNAMPFNERGQKPAWVPHGNSLKQDEARDAARRARGESNE